MSVWSLYVTAALMAMVASVCTILCAAWSTPTWRRRLARPHAVVVPEAGEICVWPARLGSALIGAGIGACAALSWYGCYCVMAALSFGSR